MEITPDAIVLWRWGPINLNATLLFTWLTMALLVLGAWLATRRLSTGPKISRWQNLLEVLVQTLQGQIREIGRQTPDIYLPFIGTLFLFIATSNLLTIVPGYRAPTSSLSTTTALAVSVFLAVPLYGSLRHGPLRYLRQYFQPSPIMLPLNLIGEISRTLALAVRLFGNAMSGSLIGGILLSIVPLFFPMIMQVLSLLTGMIQAYIFSVLAMVFIASATSVAEEKQEKEMEVTQ